MIINYRVEDSTKRGVYQIKNLINSKIYIGSTTRSFKRRYVEHFYELKMNTHCNSYLQASINKYGLDNFEFSILEVCDKNLCSVKEQYWLDYYKSYDNKIGYNILRKSDNSLGFKHSDETKKIMSDLKIGKSSHPNTIKAVILANTGKKKSQEFKDKISRIHKGKSKSLESINKRRLKILGTYFSNKRKILRLDIDLNLLNIYCSDKECSESINMSMSNIRGICNGTVIQPKSYILLYEYYPINSGRTNRKIEIKWRK